MKKVGLLLVVLLALIFTANAHLIPVYTDCGKTVHIESSQYKDTEEMLKTVEKLRDALCKDDGKTAKQASDELEDN